MIMIYVSRIRKSYWTTGLSFCGICLSSTSEINFNLSFVSFTNTDSNGEQWIFSIPRTTLSCGHRRSEYFYFTWLKKSSEHKHVKLYMFLIFLILLPTGSLSYKFRNAKKFVEIIRQPWLSLIFEEDYTFKDKGHSIRSSCIIRDL